MTHLLAISLGPVQDFIAAARRTQDLAQGSGLLQEICKAAAQSVANSQQGELIFPADLDQPAANKILALVTGDPRGVAEAARAAATAALEAKWDVVDKSFGLLSLNAELKEDQLANFLEFYAAWLPFEQNGGDYRKTRKDLEQLLAGRKALRGFQQPISCAGVAKSPLDPARDCVFKDGKVPAITKRPLNATEYLDAISLIKRASNNTGVPSTSRLAVDCFWPKAQEKAAQRCKPLIDVANAHEDIGLDVGDLFFPGRMKEIQDDKTIPADAKLKDDERQSIDAAREAIFAALGLPGEAPAYYAILTADGDRMGDLISRKDSVKEHRALSSAMSGFSEKVTQTFRKGARGYVVYSGGDDVLALVPVNEAIDCANELRAEFAAIGTLSVGIAIVHRMEPLQRAVQRARDAEHEAKKSRNALAIAVHTRGGPPLLVSDSWNAFDTAPGEAKLADLWGKCVELMKGNLSRGLPHELERLAKEFDGIEHEGQFKDDAAHFAEVLRGEIARVVKRKGDMEGNTEAGKKALEESPMKEMFEQVRTADDAKNLAMRLRIAAFLASFDFPREAHQP